MTTHADLRTLERFGLSGGHVLAYLNARQSVWLDEVNADGTRYALIYSAAADTFIVPAVTADSVVKTVLTLEMYERSRAPLGRGLRALARYAATRPMAATDDNPPAQVTMTALPLPEDPQALEVHLRRIAEREGGLAVSEMLELWVHQAPSAHWLRFGATYNRCSKDRELGYLSARGLAALGQAPPCKKTTEGMLTAAWVEQMATLAAGALARPEAQAWLLRRLEEHADVVDSLDCFYIELGCGWRSSKVPLARIDATSMVRCALGLGPAHRTLTTEAANGGAVNRAQEPLLQAA